MAVLVVVIEGHPKGSEIPLPMGEFLMGRDPEAQLRPSSRRVSRRHCVIERRADGVFLRDLGSTNGTFVNEKRIQDEVTLHDNDRIGVGPLLFECKFTDDD